MMTKRQVAQHKPGTTMTIGGPLPRRQQMVAQVGSISRTDLARLLAGVSISAAALALAALPQQARAQSAVNATPTGINATVTQSATLDQVTVSGSQATVDWALNPTGVSSGVFLNGGTTLDFQGSGSYTVLNRVNPMTLTGTLALNGSVTSTPQGKIWFYNPGGWVVGSGATIDVGSLVLTSLPIATSTFDPANPNTTGLYGANGQIQFGQAAAGSSVTVQNGASITASQSNSYVALVAPRVVQAGSVTSNGSTAYVAAGAVDIKINNGLFDILVSNGTDDANGVVHTGSTTGTVNNSSAASPQRIYLVAVPKNSAMTMLVSGNLGYNSASSASQTGGKIILSAGYGVAGEAVDPARRVAGANIDLTDVRFASDTQGTASDTINLTSTSGSFVGGNLDLSLSADKRIGVVAQGSESAITVGGNLALNSGLGGQGGNIDVAIDTGAQLRVGGNFDAHADGLGAIQTDPNNGNALLPGAAGENATGGSVKVALGNATYSVGGQTLLSANALRGLGGASVGSAQAGSVSFSSTAATSLSSVSPLNLEAHADASTPVFGAESATGGGAVGGSVALSFGGSFQASSMYASSLANSYFALDNGAQNASSGSVSISFTGGTAQVDSLSSIVSASASGRGIANGGSNSLTIDQGTVISGYTSLQSERIGNAGTVGSLDLIVRNNGGLGGNNTVSLQASARNNTTGLIVADRVGLTLDRGVIFASDLSLDSNAFAGSGFAQTDARGGAILIDVKNGGNIQANTVRASASGYGGSGSDGGDGTGGTVTFNQGLGFVTATSGISLLAQGFAGRQQTGAGRAGSGLGGTASLNLTGPGGYIVAGLVSLSSLGSTASRYGARAFAAASSSGAASAPPSGGTGGSGVGGTSQVTISDGLFSASIAIDAAGEGGNGFSGGNGGAGTGGLALLTVSGGDVSPSTTTIGADGRGGFGADRFSGTPAGSGGVGTGGFATFALTGGNFHTDSISLSATGNAPQTISFGEGGSFIVEHGGGGAAFGDGPTSAGAGGLGVGGTTTLTMTGGSLANISGLPVRAISLDSRGVGGKGGDANSNSDTSQLTQGSGGNGRGGTSNFTLSARDTDFGSISLNVSGIGGASGQEFGSSSGIPSNGGNGGSGFGGDAAITLATAVASTNSSGLSRSYSVLAGGSGADGGRGAIGGSGGTGQGGSAQLLVTAPGVFADQLSLDTYSYGGNGGTSGLGNTGGKGGDAIGGFAQLVVDGDGVTFAPTSGYLDVSAEAGRGGAGGSGLVETLDAAGDGGTAGAGRGGTAAFSASIGGTLDLSQATDFQLYTYGDGGTGGDGGNAAINFGNAIGNGGTGGEGYGGAITVSAQNGTVLLGNFATTVNGQGGSGGGRLATDSSSTDASNGGSGGSGFGGNVSFTASGGTGSIQANSLDIHVDGFGGSGVDGQGYDPVTYVGANGGAGAAGTGGSIQLSAFDHGTITLAPDSTSTLTAAGRSAFGGKGADGATDSTTGVGGAGGVGGNSGQGNGGTITLLAEGGLIQTGGFAIAAIGYGSNGSQGGFGGTGIVPPGSPVGTPSAPDGAFGGSGIPGRGVGGAVTITAQNDEGRSVGGLALGAVNLDVTGRFDFGGGNFGDSYSGQAQINDYVDESNGGVTFTSLNVTGNGDPVFNPVTLSITSRDAPIRISGGLSAGTGGTIDVLALGTGGLEIGGSAFLSSDSAIRLIGSQGGLIHANEFVLNSRGTTLVSAQNCGVRLCRVVFADNQFVAFPGGDFALFGPALVEAGTFLQASASGSVTGEAGSGYSAPGMFISAQNDVTIRNASGGSLDAEGGVVLGEGAFFVNGNLTLGEDDGSGVFDLSRNLQGLAGTSIAVLAGTSLGAGNAINLVAGDDVRIGDGASLLNTTGGDRPGFIRLDAGGQSTDGSYPAGNVRSLLIGSGAVIDGTGGSVTLSGGAIDGRGATFRGADFSADVINPPAAGVAQRNDNGQLTAPCLEGDICIGAIAAIGAVRIGQGEFAPIHFVGFGNIGGSSVAITSRDTFTYGSSATPFAIASSGPIALTSQTGDIALVGNALIDGGTVALSAGGSVTGDGRLSSAGDIGIDVGANITLASLTAARQLTTVAGIGGALESLYTVPGNLRVTNFQTGAPTVIQAGGSIVIAAANTGGNDLSLTAGTLVSLGTDSNVANLFLSGQDVTFATIGASGNIVLSAGNTIAGTGAVAGGSLTANGTTLNATTLGSGGAMALTTTGATTLGTATSGANLTISSGALSFTGLASTGATSITAASVAGGNIAAGTSLAARATGALVVGSATAGTTLSLDAATLGAATLRSGGAMSLTSRGAALIGSATSGGDLTVATGDLTFTNFSSVGATQINASNVSGGDVNAGTTLAVTSPGAIRLGNAIAGRTLTADGASLTAAALQSGGAMTLTTTGATTLGTARSGAGLSITSGSLAFTGLTSTGATTINAASIAGGDIAAGTNLATRATGAVVVGNATAGGTLSLNAQSIRAGTLGSGGAMTLSSAAATTLGTATSGADLTIASGALTFNGLTSTGATAIDAATVAGGNIAAGSSLAARALGALVVGNATAATTLSLNGASLGATTLRSGGAMSLTSGGMAQVGAATSGADLTVATGDLTFTSFSSVGGTQINASTVTGGDINAGTALAVTSPGAIRLSTATAAGTLNAKGASLTATALQSGGAMVLSTTGATALGTAKSGADLTIGSGALSFTGLTSTGATAIDATTVAGGDIAAGTSLAVRSTGALAVGNAAAATTLSLDGTTLAASGLRSGGAMTLTGAGTARLGTATSGGNLTVTTGDLSFTGLNSTGATAIRAASVAGGDIAAGSDLGVNSPGTIALGTAATGGALTLNGATIGATTLRSGGATSLTSASAITLGTSNAGTTFTANGTALQFMGITATGDLALTATTVTGGDATSTAGAIGLTATGAATIGQLRAATDVTARATTLTFAGITAGRNVTLDVTTLGGTAINAGQDLTIRSVNDLTFGTIAAGRNLSLNASSGAITVNTDIDAGGTVSLAGDAILIKAVGPLTVASVTADNGDIAITTDGLLRVSNAASRGDVTLTSTANSLILGPIVAGRALAVPLALNPSGTTKGTPGPGAITLSAAQSITMQGTVDALTALAATAGTLIDQRSLAVGKTIAYRSADLTLGQTAALGQSNFTTAIALTNSGGAGALLGDVAGTTAGYRLDNAEFGRIHSGGDVSLAAGSSLTVGTLSASAASGSGGVADGNIGATATLALSTSGDLAVGGALALSNAAGNTLRLTSSSLTLDAGTGSLRLIEGTGHGGTLAIATGELSALTSAARSAIVGMDGNAITLRLAQNDGVGDGRTLLEAGSIAIAASGRVLIQNTALGQTFDARRGFVADSFAINTSNSAGSAPLIVINGTVAGQTGLTALRAVSVIGGYDDLSTVNGCRLFTATCGTPQFDPLRDLLEDEIGRGTNLDSGDAIGEGTLIQISRFEPVGFEAVIDEPVTGSGNDDFLVPEAGIKDDQCEADDKTKCEKPPAG
jgi:filamentous hemagglutinin family protein